MLALASWSIFQLLFPASFSCFFVFFGLSLNFFSFITGRFVKTWAPIKVCCDSKCTHENGLYLFNKTVFMFVLLVFKLRIYIKYYIKCPYSQRTKTKSTFLFRLLNHHSLSPHPTSAVDNFILNSSYAHHYSILLFLPCRVAGPFRLYRNDRSAVHKNACEYEQGSSVEIKDLSPSCNRRHVRHSLLGVRRWGEGVGHLVLFFCYIKLTCGKVCLGGEAITDTIPFMCLLKGLYLRHLSLSHWFLWPEFVFFSGCLSYDVINDVIKDS